jgi:endonuclease/exonuclease/phosphatase (EEP) superfamily protein YafD
MPVYLGSGPEAAMPSAPVTAPTTASPRLVTLAPPPPPTPVTVVFADLGRQTLSAAAAAGIADLHPDIVILDHVTLFDAAAIADTRPDAALTFLPYLNAQGVGAAHGSGLACIAAASAEARPDLDGAVLHWQGPHAGTAPAGSLAVIVAHADPGLGAGGAQARHLRLAAVAEAALAEDDVVVLGALGCAPWSPPMRDLLGQGRLRDARDGFGVLPTWPAACPWLGLPLDHGLVAGAVQVRRCRVGPDLGGGHLPLVIDLAWQEPAMRR